MPTLDDVPKPPEKPKRTGGTKNLQKLLNTLEREISQLETQSSDLEQQMVCLLYTSICRHCAAQK